MANIQDVAKRAGVSIASVSLVLNNPETHRVSAAKRTKILAAAEKLHYSPNLHAKALFQKKTQIVGLVLPMRAPVVINDYIAEALSGMQSECTAQGYNLMIYPHKSTSGKITAAEMNRSHFSDGLIFMHTRLCTQVDIEATIAALVQQGRHFVMLNCHNLGPHVNSVGVDEEDIGYRASTYLASRGHKRIAFLGGGKSSPSAPYMLNGFRHGLAEAGLKSTAGLECHSEFREERICEIVTTWLKRPAKPTAIVCAYDQIVPEVYRTIQNLGLSIPKDVAIVSQGDLPLASHLTPKLTTFHVPIVDMGRQAARLLFERITENLPSTLRTKQIVLPCALIERESC